MLPFGESLLRINRTDVLNIYRSDLFHDVGVILSKVLSMTGSSRTDIVDCTVPIAKSIGLLGVAIIAIPSFTHFLSTLLVPSRPIAKRVLILVSSGLLTWPILITIFAGAACSFTNDASIPAASVTRNTTTASPLGSVIFRALFSLSLLHSFGNQ